MECCREIAPGCEFVNSEFGIHHKSSRVNGGPYAVVNSKDCLNSMANREIFAAVVAILLAMVGGR